MRDNSKGIRPPSDPYNALPFNRAGTFARKELRNRLKKVRLINEND